MDALENQLKEARFLAEEADKKYDEVQLKTNLSSTILSNNNNNNNNSNSNSNSNISSKSESYVASDLGGTTNTNNNASRTIATVAAVGEETSSTLSSTSAHEHNNNPTNDTWFSDDFFANFDLIILFGNVVMGLPPITP